MNIDLYLLAENLALTNSQRNTLVTAISGLGQGYMYPAPIRLDGQAGIYEAQFRSGDILNFGWKSRLGTIFSVDPTTIDVFVTTDTYSSQWMSTIFTFSRLGTDYLRVVLFGYIDGIRLTTPTDITALKRHSAQECSAYIGANAAAWGW